MRILIPGSRGFIGANLARGLAGGFTLCDDSGIDITSAADVEAGIARTAPDLVILAAGIADIDRCEREPELAERVNVQGALNVARVCADHSIRLQFLSTGAVFDGARHGYAEDAPVSPVSVYGRTKVEAERAIAELAPDAAILRLSLVLGRSARPGTNSLVDKLAESFRHGKRAVVPPDEFRNPIDAGTLTQWIAALARLPGARGIFHVGSSDSVSRWELVRQLAVSLGYSEDLVTLQAGSIPGRAPRGRDHFLISDKLAKLSGIPAPSWRQVAERCIDAIAESAV